MGYEIAGGLGAKMAAPDREVYVMVGDGSFLDDELRDHDRGPGGRQARHRRRGQQGLLERGPGVRAGRAQRASAATTACAGRPAQYDGEEIKVDFVKICEGLGARALEVTTLDELRDALQDARAGTETVCIVVQTDWHERVARLRELLVGDGDAAGLGMPAVVAAREEFDRNKGRQRYLMVPGAP